MASRARLIRTAIAGALLVGGLALAPGTASATFHLIKIREVSPNPAGANSSYVELQMYAFGQELVGGHTLNSYTSTGSILGSVTLPSNVANGDNQRTILIGDSATPGSPDFVTNIGSYLPTAAAGGAVCWESIDCVSWGNFTGSLPSPAGSPAPAIPSGSALVRSIAPNCPTLLEDADDTNNSLADFAIAAPSPRNNSVTPTETACAAGSNGPDTNITKGPKKKTKKKKAKFEFNSTTPGATFECSVDGKQFKACSSPFKVKVKKGKHSFEVRAVLGGVSDPSPARRNWKVKKPR